MKNKEEKDFNNVYHFVILFIVAIIAGYWLKASLKPQITSGPEDRSITAVGQSYDFKKAKQLLEEQSLEETQNQEDSEGSCG